MSLIVDLRGGTGKKGIIGGGGGNDELMMSYDLVFQ